MNHEKFEAAADAFFRAVPCEDAQSAKKALWSLYDYIVERAGDAEEETATETRRRHCWVMIQQAQSWSPLRLFWGVLAEHEMLPIRAAAKGNICESKGSFSADPEVGLMARMNLPYIMLSGQMTALQDEMAADPKFSVAIEQWTIAAPSFAFLPILTMKKIR